MIDSIAECRGEHVGQLNSGTAMRIGELHSPYKIEADLSESKHIIAQTQRATDKADNSYWAILLESGKYSLEIQLILELKYTERHLRF